MELRLQPICIDEACDTIANIEPLALRGLH